jgi:CBS domain-containing protein
VTPDEHTGAAAAGGERVIALTDALARTVGDVMMARPETLPAGARVGEVRAAFERPSQRTVLLTDGDRFVGAIERDDLPAGAGDDDAAASYADPKPLTATPGMAMTDAVELLRARGEPRLIVLDEDGVTLRGLLCAKGDGRGFCVR